MSKITKIMVWYSPKWDMLREATVDSGYLFKDSYGKKHYCYRLDTLEFADFYLIGEL